MTRIRRRARFDQHRGTLARVEPEAHIVVDDHGEPIRYDKLLVAVGARFEPSVPGAIGFAGPADAAAVAQALEQSSRLAFVLPSASGWSLPVYELAIMAAVELRGRGVEPEITVVTPESAPLWVFGPRLARRSPSCSPNAGSGCAPAPAPCVPRRLAASSARPGRWTPIA